MQPFVDLLYLWKNGVPHDVALEMDDVTRLAAVIILGELDGSKFDWSARAWRKGK